MLGTPFLQDCLSGVGGGDLESSFELESDCGAMDPFEKVGREGGRGSHQREQGLSLESTWGRGLWGPVGQS